VNDKKQNYGDNRARLNILQRSVKEIGEYRIRRRMLLTALSALVALTGLIFIGAALHTGMGRLSIGLNKNDMTQYGLALSETRDMKFATSRLNANINERITNISVEDLPQNLSMIDGEHNGENYVAYTFYLEHRGSEALTYEYEVAIKGVTKSLDEAMRVRLYIEDEYVDYAKTRNDGTGPEPGTVEFYNVSTVTRGVVEGYKPNDKTKYTIVIWLEGDDPECVDRVIDGMAKVEMNFRVLNIDAETQS
jgi:hypothetical protein